MENEKEIIKACAAALQAIFKTAQQALFYLDDREFEIEKLRESFKLLDFPSKTIERDKPPEKEENQGTVGVINFSKEEILKMPKEFRPLFRTGKVNARVRKKGNGYEIRCQIDGDRISVYGKVLYEAKAKFIVKLAELRAPNRPRKKNYNKTLLKNYMLQWLETVKKPYIKEGTYKLYLQVYRAYVVPAFGDRDITTIKAFELQEFINGFTETERFRTAQKVSQILSSLFEYAETDELISRSPMKKVKVAFYEQKHGVPLTRAEEKDFIENFKKTPTVYAQAFVFMMYTGLRRSELASAKVSDEWIVVSTAKQRKGKSEKVRRIPISPMLKQVLPLIDAEAIVELSGGVLTKRFKELCPDHHLHDLRHTFITRCQECGIQREIVSLWAGHAADSSITSIVYTHLEQYDGKQLEEMQKFTYIL